MGIPSYMVLCNAALCVFHISLLKVTLSKVLDLDIETKGKSGADNLAKIADRHIKNKEIYNFIKN